MRSGHDVKTARDTPRNGAADTPRNSALNIRVDLQSRC